MSKTYFPNTLEEFDAVKTNSFLADNQIDIEESFKQKIEAYIKQKIQLLHTEYVEDILSTETLYTGSSGVALLYYLHAKNKKFKSVNDIKFALKWLSLSTSRQVTFMCGVAGPCALSAVLSARLGINRPPELPSPAVFIEQLENILPRALATTTPDELLYGRAGYLFALLFVNRELGENLIASSVISKVVKAMLCSGQRLAKERSVGSPLLYEWHGSVYLGAAHGLAGILYMLLQAAEYIDYQDMEMLVRPSLEWLLEQKGPEGNLPSSLGRGERLVQWCHGAPGIVQLYCLASQVFKEQKFMDEALKFGEVSWRGGLTHKGYSLCHGVAGNAYAFLQLFQATGEAKHLHRACCMAEWCMDQCAGTEYHAPDSPGSLFEGLAGRLYFLSDLCHPSQAKFPAYTL